MFKKKVINDIMVKVLEVLGSKPFECISDSVRLLQMHPLNHLLLSDTFSNVINLKT